MVGGGGEAGGNGGEDMEFPGVIEEKAIGFSSQGLIKNNVAMELAGG